jgi:hypothetical protein
MYLITHTYLSYALMHRRETQDKSLGGLYVELRSWQHKLRALLLMDCSQQGLKSGLSLRRADFLGAHAWRGVDSNIF